MSSEMDKIMICSTAVCFAAVCFAAVENDTIFVECGNPIDSTRKNKHK